MTKPTLYYHFGSKQGLGEALLTRPMTEFLGVLRALNRDEPDAVRLLRRVCSRHISPSSADEPDRVRFFYAICFGPEQHQPPGGDAPVRRGDGRSDRGCAGGLAEAGVIEPGRVGACSG